MREYTDEEFGEIDLFDQIGRVCQLQVTLNETGEYSNISSIMALPKGVPAPASATPPIRWDMDHWDDKVFTELPLWAQEQIKRVPSIRRSTRQLTPSRCSQSSRRRIAQYDFYIPCQQLPRQRLHSG